MLGAFLRGVGAVHARRFAEEHVERKIDGRVVEMRVGEDEFFLLGGGADDGEGAALAFAEGFEGLNVRRRNGEHVALLRFVAPDLVRGHAGLVVGDFAKVEFAAASAVVDELGEGVGNAAGADVVDEGNGVVGAEGPAAVDHFLAAAFHLGVVALDGGEIEIFVAGAAGHRGRRAAAETDQHGGSAEDDEVVAGIDRALLDVAFLDVAQATGEHDGFMIAAEFGGWGIGRRVRDNAPYLAGRNGGFVGAEVAVDVGAAEFVVEGGGAERAIDHDVEGGDDATGFAVVFFPGLDGAG